MFGRETSPPLPWTDDQVAALNTYQSGRKGHPFTCGSGNRSDAAHKKARERFNLSDDGQLIATRIGWICPACDYRQDWAHAAMFAARSHQSPPSGADVGEADIDRLTSVMLRELGWTNQIRPHVEKVVRAVLAALMTGHRPADAGTAGELLGAWRPVEMTPATVPEWISELSPEEYAKRRNEEISSALLSLEIQKDWLTVAASMLHTAGTMSGSEYGSYGHSCIIVAEALMGTRQAIIEAALSHRPGGEVRDKLNKIAQDIEYAVAGGMSWISHSEAYDFANRIRKIAEASLASSSTEAVERDVRRLVIAARHVAFGDIPVLVSHDDDLTAAIRELDQASEAFASRVPWEGQP